LGVILLTRNTLGVETFNDWGWRIPFLVSSLLVVVSIYIRFKMDESPLFTKLKKEGKTSIYPLKESFAKRENLKMVLLALFGAVMGQGVIWYTGQFYAQSFIENVCKIEFGQSRTILLWAIAFATPFFVAFGALSDKIGRKWIMMVGMFLGIISYRSIYQRFLDITSDKNKTEILNQRTIKRTATKIKNSPDSLIETSTSLSFSDGAIFKEIKTDTLFAFTGMTGVKPMVKTEKLLGDSDYWTIVLLIFFQVFLNFVFDFILFINAIYYMFYNMFFCQFFLELLFS
jgi:MFS family permease